jgi:N-acetylmuramoyl-L-alanine amidase CwlA
MLQIQKQLINYNFSKRNEKISYICIHDVGEPSSAKNNRDYFAGGNINASADFFVDSNNIIQIIDYIKNYSFAVGDGKGKYGIKNSNSLSIEMCLEKDYQPSEQTIKNTLELTRYLMKELNIPLENVKTHNQCSDKLCPKSFSANNWEKWHDFKKQLVVSPTPQNNNTKIKYTLLWQEFYNLSTGTKSPLICDNLYGKNTQSSMDNLLVYIKQGKKYKYCLEFQKFYNLIMKSKILTEDGIWGINSERAFTNLNELVKNS